MIPGHGLTKSVAGELSALFSSSYGKWSLHSPLNPGKRIKLSPSYYLSNYAREPYHIAICRDRGHLIAQAIYINKLTVRGKVSLVVQLVVDERYRRQGIATALLHAIWGFSDYYAWGIVTSSPCTVEALEGATFRLCRADVISRRALFIRRAVLSEIPFLRNAKWLHGARSSRIDTGFFTDRQAKPLARKRVESRLGRLPEGSEWLALAFRDQALDHVGGHAVLSVSNVRFRKTAALPLLNGKDRSKFLRSIFRLRPSKVMSTTGEFFDEKTSARDLTGRVYHKEQFPAEASRLPGEYLVVDRRYASGEIQRLLNDAGLKVILRRFVRSGFGEEFSESDGKEILVIANSDGSSSGAKAFPSPIRHKGKMLTDKEINAAKKLGRR